ncbi:MAG: hypothetical protein HYX60_01055 [Legionella longbeachae]|nr:hypothetical protein [Legionella longbeachae]
MSYTQMDRSCFESDLANVILKNPDLFKSVDKVSQSIIMLLKNKKNYQEITKDHSILDETISDLLFSESSFGTLGSSINYCKTPTGLIDNIITALETKQNLQLVLHIHQIFIKKIFKHLPDKTSIFADMQIVDAKELTLSQEYAKKIKTNPDEIDIYYKEISKKIFSNDLFKRPYRKQGKHNGEKTTRIGIAPHGECIFSSETDIHENALGRFQPSPNANWTMEINKNKLPFVSGPSGHAALSMILVVTIGNLNQEEMKQYATALIGEITGGGYHTLGEIMSVCQKAGIPYSHNNYIDFLPKSFLCSNAYQFFREKYEDNSLFGKISKFFLKYSADLVNNCPSYFQETTKHHWQSSQFLLNSMQTNNNQVKLLSDNGSLGLLSNK